ncbi:MAG: hypothetical protein HKN16_08250 [Saprospiraceae bacterium]|nr:hypothetical protein [Saprospiraceae bacterium]
MKKGKLSLALESFNKLTINKLKKFVSSPYFNRDQSLVDLLVFLTSITPLEYEKLNKEMVWREFKGDSPFNDVRFRKYLSDLLGLVEQFLSLEELEADPFQRDLLLLRSLNRKGLKKLIPGTLKKASKRIDEDKHLGIEKLHNEYLLEKEKFNSEFRFDRKQRSNIQDIISTFDHFYVAERFKLGADQISRGKFVKLEEMDSFGSTLSEWLDENEISPGEMAKAYQAVFNSQKLETIDSYFTLRDRIGSLSGPLDNSEAGSIYASQINFCIRQINSGDAKFLKELFIIYKELLEKNLLVTDGRISPNTFSNVNITALRNQAYDWAENFLEVYAQYLPKDKRENLPKYELARIFFYKKEFLQVIEILREFEFTDKFDTLQTKALQIYTYYELGEFEVLDSLLKSLKIYLQRHKELGAERIKNYKNLIKLITQMISIVPGDQKRIAKLKKDLDEMKGIAANKEWLEEKIAELEK